MLRGLVAYGRLSLPKRHTFYVRRVSPWQQVTAPREANSELKTFFLDQHEEIVIP